MKKQILINLIKCSLLACLFVSAAQAKQQSGAASQLVPSQTQLETFGED